MNADDTDQQPEMSGQHERIVEFLNAFQTRLDMYINPVSPEEVEKFLIGFETGCVACGVPLSWTDVAARHGWESLTINPIVEMRAAGMSDDRIIDKLISLRIEALKLLRST